MLLFRTMVVALMFLPLAVACSDDETSETAAGGEIDGTTWVLDQASIESLDAGVSDAEITIAFDGGSVSGKAACNQYTGTYETGDGGSISIEVGGMTMMACEEPLMELETNFTVALGEVSLYSVDGEQLTLEREGGFPLTFAAG